jgi:hypothetical protein
MQPRDNYNMFLSAAFPRTDYFLENNKLTWFD